jgi:autotransporter-associated beta strand protein
MTNVASAGSATWKSSPATGDWNTAANWMPETVPDGPSDVANFGQSNGTSVSIAADIEVSDIVFDADASPFDITVRVSRRNSRLTLSGGGITNNSGLVQQFVAEGQTVTAFFSGLAFKNSATAGNMTAFTVRGHTANLVNGHIEFTETSSAASASFTNEGGRASGLGGGFVRFDDNSTAGSATFLNKAGVVSTAGGGSTVFVDSATADHATIINKGATVSGARGASSTFIFNATAANAVLVAEGGSNGGTGGRFAFEYDTRGGAARAILSGDGNLDISGHNAPGMTIGSIEGDGHVFLGANNLTVGTNNLDTVFSGIISDHGGQNRGSGGSLTKVGNGELTLGHRNRYTGGTFVQHGQLIVNNIIGSGTGEGPVQVEGGKLGGIGVISGAVSIGTGNGPGAVLAPGYLHGANATGALTIQSSLVFNTDGIYQAQVNSSNATADQVAALGVTINTGAQFSFTDLGAATLAIGTVFTAINNTSANPIAGTFSNLPDGASFSSNGNTYRVSYEGGDGNDLTLTVQ